MLIIAFVLAMFAVMTVVAARNPRAALLIVVFMAPWGGLDVDVGLRVTAYQVALAPLCLVMLLRSTQPGWSPPRLAVGALFLAMIAHGVVWSLLQTAYIPIIRAGDSPLRGPVIRAVIQIPLYLFNFSPVVLAALLFRSVADVVQAFRIYMAALVVLALIGWLQVVLWYGVGFNPIPVGILNVALGGSEAYIREGQFGFENFNIYRMNSFAGEPRNLATALVLGMLVLQALMLALRRPDWRLVGLWVFFFITTLATFSTSGAVVWAAGTAALLPAFWVGLIPIRRKVSTLFAALALILVPVALGVVAAEASGIPVIDLVAERTFDRIESNGAVEDFDLAISRYLSAHPESIVTGTGLGNAHLYGIPYLDPEHAVYAEGNVFQAKTGVVRIVSELGLIGLALFGLWYLALVWQMRPVAMAHDDLAVAVPIALLVLVVYMATIQIAGELWLMAGAMAALIRLRAPRSADTQLRLLPA
ncbi:MAG: hypothetical protein RL490_1765 [Pseudomonadota bacterium]